MPAQAADFDTDFGENNFQIFLGQLKNGRSMDTAFINVYGFDVDGLDARWAEESSGARAQAPSAPGRLNPGNDSPSVFLFFNSWLLGGLMILVLGAVFIQYIAKKLRPTQVSEEVLQRREDSDLWDE